MTDLITIENNVARLDAETIKNIALFEKQMKQIKEQEELIKQAILDEMEHKGIIKIDSEEMTINYIAPSNRETFDTKTFKAENPAVYDAYVRIIPVKSSIRIRLN